MRYNNKLCFDIYRVELGGDGGTSGLNVDTDQLVTYGKYLISTSEQLDILLDVLNSLMSSGVVAGWGDKDGKELVSGFSEFITKAKEIGTETQKLGKFAVDEAAKYNTILATSLRRMSGGGGGN